MAQRMTPDALPPQAVAWRLLDHWRRLQGEILGCMVQSPSPTPSVTALGRPGFTLRDYSASRVNGLGRALLLVPAPIKRPYIWDLTPRVSVVRTASAAGWRVFLIDWAPPDGELPAGTGLDAMVSMIAEAAAHITGTTGQPPVIAGHSLGGLLVALTAAAVPRSAAALILLEAPMAFGARAGAFAPLVAATPDTKAVTDTLGGAPGSFLNAVSVQADRETFVAEPLWDWIACQSDPEALLLHLKLRRWSLDEAPLPSRLFQDVVDSLYRRDLFLRGQLRLNGQMLNPALPHPILTVHDPHSRTVPPSSVLPLHDLARHSMTSRLESGWEPGVLLHHLAPLVGRTAHATLWPHILAWGVAASA